MRWNGLQIEVQSSLDALNHMTDSALEVAVRMARRKNRSKTEYARQIQIAQQGIDWMCRFGGAPDMRTYGGALCSRIAEVVAAGGVVPWLKPFEKIRTR